VTDDIRSLDGRHAVHFHSSRHMTELEDNSVHLIVTSPPYGIGAEYGSPGRNTPDQVEMPVLSMEDYRTFRDRLFEFYPEMARVVVPGGYCAVNLANPHTASRLFGRNAVLPLAYETIMRWIQMGWDLKADIIWMAARTIRASNRETISLLGSYPLPLEGAVSRETEHVMVFRKPGLPDDNGQPTYVRAGVDPEKRKASKLTLDEWMTYYSERWEFPGAAKQWSGDVLHPAPFPVELPRRLIRMYSIQDDTVLDPFAGTGTTAQAAKETGRRSVSYEVNNEFRRIVESKLRPYQKRLSDFAEVEAA
jgi:modification methylase